MSEHRHGYDVHVTWTGDLGAGTRSYRGFSRDHEVGADGPPLILGSADPAFRGDPARWNPEQLLLASLAQCHMLWYLHLTSSEGIVVTGYEDAAHGEMRTDASGAGEFTRAVLRPRVRISAGDPVRARELHGEVGRFCFIARSVRFPVEHEPEILTA